MKELNASRHFALPTFPENTVLVVDDDPTFLATLESAMTELGFRVCTAGDLETALALARADVPDYAVVDLALRDDSALPAVASLHDLHPRMHVVLMSGFASISAAVSAVRLGAGKSPDGGRSPAAAPESATLHPNTDSSGSQLMTKPVHMVESEYLQQILQEHHGNVSETARTLGMHRRTLQRKLAKRPARE